MFMPTDYCSCLALVRDVVFCNEHKYWVQSTDAQTHDCSRCWGYVTTDWSSLNSPSAEYLPRLRENYGSKNRDHLRAEGGGGMLWNLTTQAWNGQFTRFMAATTNAEDLHTAGLSRETHLPKNFCVWSLPRKKVISHFLHCSSLQWVIHTSVVIFTHVL